MIYRTYKILAVVGIIGFLGLIWGINSSLHGPGPTPAAATTVASGSGTVPKNVESLSQTSFLDSVQIPSDDVDKSFTVSYDRVSNDVIYTNAGGKAHQLDSAEELATLTLTNTNDTSINAGSKSVSVSGSKSTSTATGSGTSSGVSSSSSSSGGTSSGGSSPGGVDPSGNAGSDIAVPEFVAQAPLPIVHQEYFKGERELFGYSPKYKPNTVTFDIYNRPTIRDGYLIQTINDGSWVRINWYEKARQVFSDWRHAAQTGPFADERVVFDKDGWAYTIVNNYYYNRPRTPWEARLLYSTNYPSSPTPTWKGIYLGPGKARIEFNDSWNKSDYPPAVLRWNPISSDANTMKNRLYLDILKKSGSSIIISDSKLITHESPYGLQAGAGNGAVSVGENIHVVYPGDDGGSKGTPQYAVTYNRSSKELTEPFLLGYGATADPGNHPDSHCIPAISVDSEAYLHVVLGAHNKPLYYRKSLVADSTEDGWAPLEDIGLPSNRAGYKNSFTYVSLCCGKDNSLHVVARASGQGGPKNKAKQYLVYFRKKKGVSWEVLRELVIPFKTSYSNYYHNLNIDRKGRLFLSYKYFTNWMSQPEIYAYQTKWPNEKLDVDLNRVDRTDPAGARYYCTNAKWHDPVILMSDDGGDTWQLVTTDDFVNGLL